MISIMNRRSMLKIKTGVIILFMVHAARLQAAEVISFNHDWQFKILSGNSIEPSALLMEDALTAGWEPVDLPHTVMIEPVDSPKRQWQGLAAYRKFFTLPEEMQDKIIYLRFEAAMQNADIYLNGILISSHHGGYIPFVLEISRYAEFRKKNSILVILDNRDDPFTPPGKPLADLDFNYYSGLYRGVSLQVCHKIHISDAILENREAGGGVMTWAGFPAPDSAVLFVKAEVRNRLLQPAEPLVVAELYDADGKLVADMSSERQILARGQAASYQLALSVKDPERWSPEYPYLYRLKVMVLHKGQVTDIQEIITGLRQISFSASRFMLNGNPYKIRGTNRHQEYPYIGYALSEKAQFRDAWKIKQAGFNFVRCSHYPQSPAFLDACDRLGILVMNSIPGWQYFGDSLFQQRSIQDIRDMARRDRNHPSIILWEASLNESGMSNEYMKNAHATVHRELPYEGIYTCGWLDTIYDVFIPARQHATAPFYWNRYDKNKPILIAEYGDWEYYAQNAGFNQKEFADLKEEERTSRQRRKDGQKRLLQQAVNYQESHNDNLKGPAAGDANWLMFDYKRGYAPDIESSGIMDIYRLPKFAHYFYQSQADPGEGSFSPEHMVYIANYWDDPAFTRLTVYSNCDSVSLSLNGVPLSGSVTGNSEQLAHPPYEFAVPGFTPGTLLAQGFSIGQDQVRQVASFSRTTPGSAHQLVLWGDLGGKPLSSGENDVIFIYAGIHDADGHPLQKVNKDIKFSVEGPGILVGDNPVMTEAGIACILLRAGRNPGTIRIKAETEGLQPGKLELVSE